MVQAEQILANKNLIPFFGLDRQYAQLRDELLDASDRVYRTGKVLDGEYTNFFERQMALRCQRTYAVTVNSCTQGLIFALMTSVVANSRVLIPSVSFSAAINSVLMAGHTPVLCDTDDNALIDLDSLDYALAGAGVNTIMYANLFGHTVDWNRFKIQTEFFNKDMLIIEDAAQSFGAYYQGQPSGSLGDISVLSFDPTKNLSNYGSGGMILTDDYNIAEAVMDIKDNGKLDGNNYQATNSKMSEADCAQMLVKLKYFDGWQQRRTDIANYYIKHLSNYVDVVLPGPGVVSAWHKFVIKTSDRFRLKQHLESCGIETKIHYDRTIGELPVAWEYVDYNSNPYREATAYTRECLSLPIYPEMTDAEVEAVVNAVVNFLR
jgi:dTDP-4-amino-4,6-dideoxygalactose transaminase